MIGSLPLAVLGHHVALDHGSLVHLAFACLHGSLSALALALQDGSLDPMALAESRLLLSPLVLCGDWLFWLDLLVLFQEWLLL